jgi:Ran GTPase-activating protein (RanGAP) involved in mRNA processing and transport
MSVNAQVDDGECASFIDAVKANKSLKELDLSNNKIGDQENYNTVFPDFTTGGEAIAELLSDEACQIEILHLQWNKIRLDSGVKIADSLQHNHCLIYLDLSYNTLGRDGGHCLGQVPGAQQVPEDDSRHK